jgi:heterodisulfide reductase subunit A
MEEVRIGIYICHCGKNIAGVINPKRIVEHLSRLPNVVVAKEYLYMCSSPGQSLIEEDIKEYNLNRIIVAACSPRMHEPTFQSALIRAGLNPYLLEMVNIREHATWVHERDPAETEQKVIGLIRAAVHRAINLYPLEVERLPVVKSVLVVGGGIAGIRASLDLAKAGYKVYLVEKNQSIGGKMAQLDKTFPTLDCSQCILTPMMVDVSNNPNIVLQTYSVVEEINGRPGEFEVKVRQKARYVDWDACTGCGTCVEKCPARVPSEFDEGLGTRKAIYFDFPQAIPRRPVIDPDHCLYLIKGVCRVCEKFCPTGAIKFEDEDQFLTLKVGAIVVATGYQLYDMRKMYEYGYGRYRNVITGMQLERLSSANGPTSGRITTIEIERGKIKPGKEPETVAIILCAGSRDENHIKYCCRIGCMAGLKHAYYIAHALPNSKIIICYTDIRAFGKGFEEFYQRIRSLPNVFMVRGRPMEIFENKDGSLILDVFDSNTNRRLTINADLVVLETALVPPQGFEEFRKILKISCDPGGFGLELHPKLKPVETTVDGIYLAGFIQGPKDIPDTVAHAGAAAAAASAFLAKGYIESIPYLAHVDEDICSGCGVCVSVCPYDAITIEVTDGRRLAKVNSVKCKGCGACAAACPSGAMQQHYFTDKQILSEVSALAEGVVA